MEELSKLTAEIVDKIAELAVSYNVNIISGSMPILENGNLYNTSYLLHRDGKRDEYRKYTLLLMNENTTVCWAGMK